LINSRSYEEIRKCKKILNAANIIIIHLTDNGYKRLPSKQITIIEGGRIE